MFPKLWNLLNPRKWFARKPVAIALPASSNTISMEVQDSPEPKKLKPNREISNASSCKTSKSEISPYRSESASPERNRESDAEAMDESEPKLHELSDGESSSDDEDELSRHAQLNTPPNSHGPSNIRRTSLIMKKRKLSESSDEESAKSSKSCAKRNKPNIPRPVTRSSLASNESNDMDASMEAIREPTRKNRKISLIKRENNDEINTPTSSRKVEKRVSVKKVPFSPAMALAPSRASSKARSSPMNKAVKTEKAVASSSDSKDVRKKIDEKKKALLAVLQKTPKQKKTTAPVQAKSVKKNRKTRDSTPSSVASTSRARDVSPPPSMPSIRPQRSCRAMTLSPSRVRDTVTPARSLTKATPATGKKAKKTPFVV